MQMQIIIDRFLRSEKSHSLKLDSHCRILMMMLASYMANKNECWPSYESLMLDCGMAKGTLSKSIKKIESLKIIEIKRQFKMNNIYSFLLSSTCELKIVDNSYSRVQNDEFSSSKQWGSRVQGVDANNIINNINNNIRENIDNENKIKAENAKQEIRRLCNIKRFI